MPLFEYKCDECFVVIELLEDREASTTCTCGKCGGLMTRQFPLSCFKVTRGDLDWFGTPQYADASAKRCGVDI